MPQPRVAPAAAGFPPHKEPRSSTTPSPLWHHAPVAQDGIRGGPGQGAVAAAGAGRELRPRALPPFRVHLGTGGSPWGSPALPRPRSAGASAPSAAPVLCAEPPPGRGSPGALAAAPAGARPDGRPEPPGAGSPRVLPLLADRLRSPGAPFPPTRFLLGMVPAMLPTCRSLSAFHSMGDVRALAGNYW